MSALSIGTGGGPAGEGVWAILLVVSLALLVAGYGRGIHELWSRRGASGVVPGWRVAAFGGGVVTVLAAQAGTVPALAERSFAGHMAQHMLLVLVAGPLLAAGAAGLPLTLACPAPARRRLARWRAGAPARWLRRPTVFVLLAGAVQTVVLWGWHLPALYVAALQDPAVHALEHLSFIGSAWLLWSPVLGAPHHRPPAPVGLLLLFGTMLPASALGAVLTFAPTPVYPPAVFGGDPLADQQLAGLVMWAPMDVMVLAAALTVFLRWLLRLEREIPPGGGPALDRAPAAERGV